MTLRCSRLLRGITGVLALAVGGALLSELNHFLLHAQGRATSQVVTVDDGLNAVVAALAMIDSATRNEEVAIAWP